MIINCLNFLVYLLSLLEVTMFYYVENVLHAKTTQWQKNKNFIYVKGGQIPDVGLSI